MIEGERVQELVELFETRQVSLFHACQFVDFQSYLDIGGVPSRACLETKKQPFTKFTTDRTDHQHGVWDKVFLNLSDFGRTFAHGHGAVPNPYGPITIQLCPQALSEASDVAVCLRSAGAKDFDRSKEALRSVTDIDCLFRYPSEAGFPQSAEIKYADERQRDFHLHQTSDPEVSCAVASGFLSLNYVVAIWVDPYSIRDKPLSTWVEWLLFHSAFNFRTHERHCKSERRSMYNELVAIICNFTPSLRELSHRPDSSSNLQTWVQQLRRSPHLEEQFRRYAQYLREGTLIPLLTLNA